ncbi:MAG: hypothetical protein AB7V77_00800 [Candidatus Woesearchaeota archaeon]
MGRAEYYYTGQHFRTITNPFLLEHIKEYLYGDRTVPVFKTKSEHCDKDIFFTFSNELLENFIKNPMAIKKPYEAAVKYGFRGYSTGEKNGIFLLRKQDSGLITAVEKLIPKHEINLRDDLDIMQGSLDELKKVKIVWHEPSGKRIVGAYNSKNNRIYFLDFAKY